MATAADKTKWDKLHADLEKAYEAKDAHERQLGAKYGHHFQLPWLGSGERKKLEQLQGRVSKTRDKIIDLLIKISPRGERWLSGAPSYWIARELTWEDAIRPAGEPLSVVVPGAYGYPDGYVKERRAPAHVRSTRTTENRKMADDKEIPIANPGDYDDGKTLYQFQFGAYADTKVYVWADNDDDAFEIAVEWADDHAKGIFTTLDEDDLREAAEDLGIEWDEMWSDGGKRGRKEFGSTWSPNDDRDYNKIVEHAEADLTVVGWTTLNSGTHVLSYEVHFHEVTDEDEIADVADESKDDDEEEEDDEDDDDDVFSDDEMREGYTISDARDGGYNVSHEGKHFGDFDSIADALSEIEVQMKRDGFYPNIYYVNDHGNIDLLDAEGNSIKSRV